MRPIQFTEANIAGHLNQSGSFLNEIFFEDQLLESAVCRQGFSEVLAFNKFLQILHALFEFRNIAFNRHNQILILWVNAISVILIMLKILSGQEI
nr:MAG TPA: hypothetical protein [Caudoviricetes sp.]DAU40491.1 MAG TPA: hypothetical protein [Caudoviricetes sp.]